jgi:hypothetical protein
MLEAASDHIRTLTVRIRLVNQHLNMFPAAACTITPANRQTTLSTALSRTTVGMSTGVILVIGPAQFGDRDNGTYLDLSSQLSWIVGWARWKDCSAATLVPMSGT